ncbi:hypothetical protein ACJX0J_036667, partial [Zea mays]
ILISEQLQICEEGLGDAGQGDAQVILTQSKQEELKVTKMIKGINLVTFSSFYLDQPKMHHHNKLPYCLTPPKNLLDLLTLVNRPVKCLGHILKIKMPMPHLNFPNQNEMHKGIKNILSQSKIGDMGKQETTRGLFQINWVYADATNGIKVPRGQGMDGLQTGFGPSKTNRTEVPNISCIHFATGGM